jgi:hypothetical protein
LFLPTIIPPYAVTYWAVLPAVGALYLLFEEAPAVPTAPADAYYCCCRGTCCLEFELELGLTLFGLFGFMLAGIIFGEVVLDAGLNSI